MARDEVMHKRDVREQLVARTLTSEIRSLPVKNAGFLCELFLSSVLLESHRERARGASIHALTRRLAPPIARHVIALATPFVL